RLTDVFAIQTDVALQIAAALKAELSPDEKSRLHQEPTSDLQAYQLYLQGRHCYLRYTAEGSRRGIEYFEQAVAKDPNYALADVARALLRAGRYDEALQAATHAVELDPHYARAHATLGWAYLKKGIVKQGVAELEIAVSLSPGDTLWLAQLGQAYGMVGDGARARNVLHQLEELS